MGLIEDLSATFVAFVIEVAELTATARTPTNLHGMRRWGYVEVEGWARSASGPPPLVALVRPTARGAKLAAIWDDLSGRGRGAVAQAPRIPGH